MPEPGLWLLLFPLSMLAGMVANLAIGWLALRPGTTVGEALSRGAARLPALLGAFVLLIVAGVVAMFVVSMVVVAVTPGAMSAAEAGAPTPELGMAMLLVGLLLLPLLLYFGARLAVLTPAAAVEPAGPIQLIRRSWQLSRGHAGKLVGFLLLFGLLVAVASTALQAVAGILFAMLFGPLEPGSLSRLLVIIVMAGFNTVLTTYIATMLARVYAQLTGDGPERVFD
jgi:hypothetical protein